MITIPLGVLPFCFIRLSHTHYPLPLSPEESRAAGGHNKHIKLWEVLVRCTQCGLETVGESGRGNENRSLGFL